MTFLRLPWSFFHPFYELCVLLTALPSSLSRISKAKALAARKRIESEWTGEFLTRWCFEASATPSAATPLLLHMTTSPFLETRPGFFHICVTLLKSRTGLSQLTFEPLTVPDTQNLNLNHSKFRGLVRRYARNLSQTTCPLQKLASRLLAFCSF